MTRDQLRQILVAELDKALDTLPVNAPHHIDALRRGEEGPAFKAVLDAMEIAVRGTP